MSRLTFHRPSRCTAVPSICISEALTLLDAYAVIAYLRGEPAAGEVRPLLEGSDVTMTAVGVAEVIDHLVRLAGTDEEEAALDLGQLGLLEGIPIETDFGSSSRDVWIGIA